MFQSVDNHFSLLTHKLYSYINSKINFTVTEKRYAFYSSAWAFRGLGVNRKSYRMKQRLPVSSVDSDLAVVKWSRQGLRFNDRRGELCWSNEALTAKQWEAKTGWSVERDQPAGKWVFCVDIDWLELNALSGFLHVWPCYFVGLYQ